MIFTHEDRIRAKFAVEEYAKAHADDAEAREWARDFLSRIPVPRRSPPQPVHWWRGESVACGDHESGSINSSPYRVTCAGCKRVIGKNARATVREFQKLMEGA